MAVWHLIPVGNGRFDPTVALDDSITIKVCMDCNKCIRDDTKGATRRSPNCIGKTKNTSVE